MAAFTVSSNVHPFWETQIALLDVDEIIIPSKYADYTNIFTPDSAIELLKHTSIKDHPIDQIDNKQPPYDPIYSLRPVEPKRLKTYIKINLANGFIRPFKSSVGTLILLIHKKNSSF